MRLDRALFVLTASIVLACGSSNSTPAPSTASAGTIVPLYSEPAAWSAFIEIRAKYPTVPVVAIVDMTETGPVMPPEACDPGGWAEGIHALRAADVTVLGYVDTDYTSTDQSTVEARIDRWKECFSELQGVMFDQMANQPSDVSYYAAVVAHAKAQGFSFTVGNPGTEVPDSFFDGATTDVIFVYESAGLPADAPLSQYAVPRDQVAVIPYGVPGRGGDPSKLSDEALAWVRTVKQDCKYIYLTDDILPNPWDNLSTYFESLLAALAE